MAQPQKIKNFSSLSTSKFQPDEQIQMRRGQGSRENFFEVMSGLCSLFLAVYLYVSSCLNVLTFI